MLVDYASGAGAPNDWLTLLSQQLYNNRRLDPSVMNGLGLLVMASTGSTQTFSAGTLVVSNSLGSGSNVFQFVNSAPVTINPSQTLQIAVQATAPGAAFNLASGSVTSIITPRPGMTFSNPMPGNSAVTSSGGATGVVTVGGSPNGNFAVVVKVLSTGVLGVATMQVSLDGGSDFAAPVTIPAGGVYPIPTLNGLATTGISLNMSGTFTSGDSYTFTSYASWILVGGTDLETDLSLQTRDKARWPTLGVTQANPPLVWTLLVQATPNGGSEAVKVQAAPDLTVGGQLNITVAGPAGPVSSTALANISAFVAARAPLGTKTVTSNAVTQTIAIVAVVYVVAAQQSAAAAAITTAFAQLAAATPIQGLVTFLSIENCFEQQASGVTNAHVTTPAPNTDTQLGASATVAFDLTGVSYVLQ